MPDPTEDLLRATFAAQAGRVEHTRAIDLMRYARAGTGATRARRPAGARSLRRWPGVPLGIAAAAALVLVAVVLGALLGPSPTEPAVPAGPTAASAPRRLDAAESTALWERMARAVEDAGTLSVRVGTGEAAGRPLPGAPTPAPPGATTGDVWFTAQVDLRTRDTPRARLWKPDEDRPGYVMVGHEAWKLTLFQEQTPAGGHLTRYVPTPALSPAALVPFTMGWGLEPADTAWSLGPTHVDGAPADHYRLVSGTDDGGRPVPPQADPSDGRGVLDVWLAPDSGRLLGAALHHDLDTMPIVSIEYGADVDIAAPPPGQRGPAAPTGRP